MIAAHSNGAARGNGAALPGAVDQAASVATGSNLVPGV
jgi:hypothetical protein